MESFDKEIIEKKRFQFGKNWAKFLNTLDEGYPFEFSMPEEIFLFFKSKGYVLQNLKSNKGGHGCNEYLFRKL